MKFFQQKRQPKIPKNGQIGLLGDFLWFFIEKILPKIPWLNNVPFPPIEALGFVMDKSPRGFERVHLADPQGLPPPFVQQATALSPDEGKGVVGVVLASVLGYTHDRRTRHLLEQVPTVRRTPPQSKHSICGASIWVLILTPPQRV